MTALANDWRDRGPEGFNRNGAGTGTEPKRPAANLTIIEGCGAGHSWELCGPMTSIGRGPRNDVVLDFGDRAIHRDPHAAIQIDGAILRVHDVRRGNPVFVNDQVVDGHRDIDLGDQIRVGTTTLRLDPT